MRVVLTVISYLNLLKSWGGGYVHLPASNIGIYYQHETVNLQVCHPVFYLYLKPFAGALIRLATPQNSSATLLTSYLP